MKTKIRMMVSKGSGGESWAGVLKFPIVPFGATRSVYRETCVFCEEVFCSSARSSSSEYARAGAGVATLMTGP